MKKWFSVSFLLFSFSVTFFGCEEDRPMDPPDESIPATMFDNLAGLGVELDPVIIAAPDTNHFLVNVLPNFSGTGYVTLVGHGGGSPIGELVAPVNQELGDFALPVRFVGGQALHDTFSVAIYESFSYVAITFGVAFDSLEVEGGLVGIRSPEAVSLLGFNVLNGIGKRVTLNQGE